MASSQMVYPTGFCVGLYRPVESSCEGVVDLGDRRRQCSFDWLSERMSKRKSCCIHQISDSETQRKRAQRLLNNTHISCSDFLGACCIEYGALSGQDIVNVCDQTELHFSSCIGRLSEDLDHLGVVGSGMQRLASKYTPVVEDKKSFTRIFNYIGNRLQISKSRHNKISYEKYLFSLPLSVRGQCS